MPITLEDYYRNGHVYLENPNGRREVFALLREGIEGGLREGKDIVGAVAGIRILKGYIKGDSFIFLNQDLPNVSLLSKKRGEIQEDAVRFLRDILPEVERVYMETRDASHRFDILYLLARFMPEIPEMNLRHYTDLYLLMFHTLLFPDMLAGKEKDISDLMDLVLRALCRYDCTETGETFVRDLRHKELLRRYAKLYPPYERYVKRITDAIKRMEVSGAFREEEFAPLLFTDRLFYLLKEHHEDALFKNRDVLFSFIGSRCTELFRGKEEGGDALLNAIRGIIEDKAERLKKGASSSATPDKILYQREADIQKPQLIKEDRHEEHH